jgi:hypothetical protein
MDKFLEKSPFRPRSKYYKGDVPPEDNPQKLPRPDSGFVVLVSHDEKGDDLSGQIQPACNFLLKNEEEIHGARGFGADNFLLDFGLVPGQQMQSSLYLPPELIEVLGRLGMGLRFSVIQIGQG